MSTIWRDTGLAAVWGCGGVVVWREAGRDVGGVGGGPQRGVVSSAASPGVLWRFAV